MKSTGMRATGASPVGNYRNVDLFKIPEFKQKKSLHKQKLAQTFRTLQEASTSAGLKYAESQAYTIDFSDTPNEDLLPE